MILVKLCFTPVGIAGKLLWVNAQHEVDQILALERKW